MVDRWYFRSIKVMGLVEGLCIKSKISFYNYIFYK